MHKITRLAFNTDGWRRPTASGGQNETGTYVRKHGFGYEDWLFRSEWVIAGWRYGFLQGFSKGRKKLLKIGETINATLFTVEPDKKRRFVATIYGIECLDDKQAEDALDEFKKRRWYDTMEEEVKKAGGTFRPAKCAKDVLNIRFRQKCVALFPAGYYAARGSAIYDWNRYQLYDADPNQLPICAATPRNAKGGSMNPPNSQPYQRRGTPAVECTREHARMQCQLIKELNRQYRGAVIKSEQDYVDVSVETPNDIILFEIKSDLDPKTVIREALGQVMEYAYHPTHKHVKKVSLVIVGRRALHNPDKEYLRRLQDEFRLPISYRVVAL